MNKINHEPADDLAEGRWWLKRAAQLFESEDVASTQAYTAAVIGNGFIGLAHTTSSLASMAEVSQVRSAILTMSDEPETTLGEAIERERRAEAEARPHDDEPKRRCCIGPFADGSHAVNCTQRCQDCGGDDDENSPRRCRCRDGKPAARLCGCTRPDHDVTCPDFVPEGADRG